MANQNTIADLSTTSASNLNFKGQSMRGTALANTIDSVFQNEASMLKAFYDSLGGAATVSGTDTYTVTVTEDWAAYASGLVLAIKVPNANTGAATLNVTVPTAGALGAKAIRRQGDSALSANDMLANGVYLLRYSTSYNSAAGAWVLLNPNVPDAASPGMTDEQRRNALLKGCDLAKLLAAYQRELNTFLDGYKASDGVNSGSSSNYLVNTTSGYAGPSSTDTRISGGTPSSPNFGGTAANFNDNNTGTTFTTGALGTVANNFPARIVAQIDYGSNKTITKIEAVGIALSTGSDSGHGFVYSTDGTNWTQFGTNLPTITTTPQTVSKTGSVTARYIALITNFGGFGSATLSVQDFNGYQPVANNMTVVTTTQTADATVSNGRVLMEIDPIDSITLGTDLTIEVTCDGGAHWTPAGSYTSCGKGQSGRTVIETDDVACTSGTSFAAQIKTLNNKSVNVYKTAIAVH